MNDWNLKSIPSQSGRSSVTVSLVLLFSGLIITFFVYSGLDLVQFGQNLAFQNWIVDWESRQTLFRQRMGRLAGDRNRNGIIGDIPKPYDAVEEIQDREWEQDLDPEFSTLFHSARVRFGHGSADGSIRSLLAVLSPTYPHAFPEKWQILVRDLDRRLEDRVDARRGSVRGFVNASLKEGSVVGLGPAASRGYTDAAVMVYFFDSSL